MKLLCIILYKRTYLLKVDTVTIKIRIFFTKGNIFFIFSKNINIVPISILSNVEIILFPCLFFQVPRNYCQMRKRKITILRKIYNSFFTSCSNNSSKSKISWLSVSDAIFLPLSNNLFKFMLAKNFAKKLSFLLSLNFFRYFFLHLNLFKYFSVIIPFSFAYFRRDSCSQYFSKNRDFVFYKS